MNKKHQKSVSIFISQTEEAEKKKFDSHNSLKGQKYNLVIHLYTRTK